MGFVIFLIYVMLIYMRPIEMFAPQLMALRPMVILLVIAFGAGLVSSLKHKEDFAARKRHIWVLSGFVFCIFVSKLLGGSFGEAIDALAQFSSTALLYVLVSMHVNTAQRLRATCYVIMFSIFVLSIAAIASYETGYMLEQLVYRQAVSNESTISIKDLPPIPADDHSGAFMYRVHSVGFFDDPNDFAQMIVSLLPWLVLFYRPGKWLRNVVFVGVPLAVFGATIFLTHSRGALLGIAAMLFFGVRKALGPTKTVLLIAVMGVGAVASGFLGGRSLSTKEESAEGRIEAWIEGFGMLRSSPLFGVGYMNFTDFNWLTAHNAFVLCFAELGLVGFFFWIALIVLAFQAVNQVAENAPAGSDIRQMGALMRASLLGFMACSWFLSRTYQPTLYVLLALCVASWHIATKSDESWRVEAASKSTPWAMATIKMMVMAMSAVQAFIFVNRH
jgi:putative inorganic carbon (HCO3(-)) transporter